MLNVVALVGRLVADPELRYTPSGVAVCSLRIAVDRWTKSDTGEKDRQTDFFDLVAWRHTAEFAANYLGKGRLVSVSGKLQQRSWVQQDGQKRSKVEIVVDDLQALDRPRTDQTQTTTPYEDVDSTVGVAPTVELTGESDVEFDPFSDE